MPLPNFTITGNLNEILTTYTGGELATAAFETLELQFTTNIKSRMVRWAGELYEVYQPIVATVGVDGSISIDGNPVTLLANDPGLNVVEFKWTVKVVQYDHTLAQWRFTAPGDGETIDLSEIAPNPVVSIH